MLLLLTFFGFDQEELNPRAESRLLQAGTSAAEGGGYGTIQLCDKERDFLTLRIAPRWPAYN